jgi:hypothetical protein
MPTYVYRDGQFVDKAIAGPRHVASSAPAVHSDTMAPLKHMATGRVLDSKSQFRADTKARGTIEVGNDPAALRDRPPITPRGVHEDVKRALAELRSR